MSRPPTYKKILSIPVPRPNSLSSPRYRKTLNTIADAIVEYTKHDPAKVLEMSNNFAERRIDFTYRLAAKLAYSSLLVESIKQPLCISVVFAMYKEKNRIHRSAEHPHGENLLRAKIQQLKWLFQNNPYIRWRLFIVDDGSPDGSGYIARYILESEYNEYLERKQVQVLFMRDAITEKLPYLSKVRTVEESGKGSSLMYGLDVALRSTKLKKNERHILVYTDADLSVHLRQLGIMLMPFISDSCQAVIGQRRLPDSVVRRSKYKLNRGKLYIYMLKQLIPQLKGFILDPQAPLKAIEAEAFEGILSMMRQPGFSFDIEFLLMILLKKIKTCHVGIGFLDSEKESSTQGKMIHLTHLKEAIKIRRRHLPKAKVDTSYEAFIESCTPEQWAYLTEHIPRDLLKTKTTKLDTLKLPVDIFKMVY